MRVDAPPPEFKEAALRLLKTEKPDWLHFHTFGVTEAAMAGMAQQRGIPYAFSYHSPAWTCRRETMLLHGKEPCDGEVRAWRCSACQSEERLGLGRIGGQAAAAGSLALGWGALPFGRTALRRRTAFYYDTVRFRCALRRFLSDCSLVVSCCDWSRPVLLRNGARPETVQDCPQGVSTDFHAVIEATQHKMLKIERDAFTIGYVGRLVPVKGAHILMEGFSQTEEPKARLRIVGWEPENAERPYGRKIQELAAKDARIQLVPKTTLNGTIEEYRHLSLLAIPSVWMETGPLTLFEALAAGVPVYGTRRIGQLGLLRERGRIVEPNTPEAWRKAIDDAFALHQRGSWPAEVENARGDGRLRTMANVAEEMINHFRSAKLANPLSCSL
jgi:glycosyltransferase involved in cell wall biosynthesis